MSKILITGFAGFIGSHLQDKLIELGHEVIGVDDFSSGKFENVNPKISWYGKFPISELGFENDSMGIGTDGAPEFSNIDYIFHLAAIPRIPYSIEHPIETHNVNVNGTLNVLEQARKWKVKKVIFASSSSVYGDQRLPYKESLHKKPISPYALHKSIGEEYMRLFDIVYGLPTLSLRFFNVYGPRCNADSPYSLVIGKFLKMKAEGKSLTIFGDGEQSRDFTYVDDVVRGLVAAMEKPVHNEVINLCNGKTTTINKIAELIGGEKEYLPPRKGDVARTLGDPWKANALLDWRGEISIEKGLELMQSGER